jgi:hypothetical protein
MPAEVRPPLASAKTLDFFGKREAAPDYAEMTVLLGLSGCCILSRTRLMLHPAACGMEMSVENLFLAAKFSGFPENTRVYDDFPIASRESKCRAEVLVAAVCFWLLSAPQSIREKNEKEPATIPLVGYLNSRSANLVSSFAGSGFPGVAGGRSSNYRLESQPRHLLETRHSGAGRATGA